MELEGREYRVAGLEKTIGSDALKVTLRLRLGDRFPSRPGGLRPPTASVAASWNALSRKPA